jgi:hypothetical protein
MHLTSNQVCHYGRQLAWARCLLVNWLPVNWLLANCLLVSLGGQTATAHPFHISTAEVEYDTASQRLQVSLKMQAVDLEQALARQVGRRVNVEHADTREHIIHFLDRAFYVSSQPLSSQPLSSQPGDVAPEPADNRPNLNRPKLNQPVSNGSVEKQSRAHWVGQELKGAWLWIYFELELPSTSEPLWLVNSVLFDVNEQQINTVSVRHGTQRTTLKMTMIQPSAKFESKWMHRD